LVEPVRRATIDRYLSWAANITISSKPLESKLDQIYQSISLIGVFFNIRLAFT
jgi:hypothetical protein